jgi:ketosteroid isomerase-like protein
MAEEQRVPLPPVVTAYIAATNAFDGDALIDTFSDDALVNDARREFWGKAAIRAWADRELIGDKVTLAAVRAIAHHGDVIVVAKVDGNYAKAGLPDPLLLTFYFTVTGDRITKLIIIHTKPAW